MACLVPSNQCLQQRGAHTHQIEAGMPICWFLIICRQGRLNQMVCNWGFVLRQSAATVLRDKTMATPWTGNNDIVENSIHLQCYQKRSSAIPMGSVLWALSCPLKIMSGLFYSVTLSSLSLEGVSYYMARPIQWIIVLVQVDRYS